MASYQKEINQLEVQLRQYYFEQNLLEEKWRVQLHKYHFGNNYLSFVPSAQLSNEIVSMWASLMARKSHFQAGKIWLQRQKLTRKILKLEAELNFYKSLVDEGVSN